MPSKLKWESTKLLDENKFNREHSSVTKLALEVPYYRGQDFGSDCPVAGHCSSLTFGINVEVTS